MNLKIAIDRSMYFVYIVINRFIFRFNSVMDKLNLAPFIKELFAMDEMHEEYKDDEIHFSIDS